MSISPPSLPLRPNNNQSTRILSGNSLAFLLAVRIVMKWLVRTPRGAFLKKINLEAQDYLASRWKEGNGGRGSERGGGELQPTRTSRSASQHQLLPSLPSHHPLLSAPHHPPTSHCAMCFPLLLILLLQFAISTPSPSTLNNFSLLGLSFPHHTSSSFLVHHRNYHLPQPFTSPQSSILRLP